MTNKQTIAPIFFQFGVIALACLATAILTRKISRPTKTSPPACEETIAPDKGASIERPQRGSDSFTVRLPHEASREQSTADRIRRTHADGIRDLFRVKAMAASHTLARAGAGIEAQANSIHPYLLGVVAAIRETDPELFPYLKNALADDICAKRATDVDTLTFSNLAILEPSLASARALDCAIANNGSQENIILWSLLDAWNASGREPLPALAPIERSASDERTRDRLLPPDQRKVKIKQIINEATSSQMHLSVETSARGGDQ